MVQRIRRWAAWCAVPVVIALASAVPLAAAGVFPEPASPVQRQWQSLFTQVFWVALAVFLIVEGLLLYALVRFRRRPGSPQEGPNIHGNTRLEVAWTIGPTLVMAWLFVISLQGLKLTDEPPPADFVVEVYGAQFYWEFAYPPDYRNTTRDVFYVEEDRNVGLRVQSRDVIHAFGVPELGIMIDAIPGKTTHFWFRADHPGNYTARCRELCGVGHSKMVGRVDVFPVGTQPQPWGPPPSPTPTQNVKTTPAATNTTAPTNATTRAADVTQDVELREGFRIIPTDYEAQPGQTLLLRVRNTAPIVHNLYIGAFDANAPDHGARWKTPTLETGDSYDLAVELPAEAGKWEWWCDVPGHREAGMVGTLSTGGGLAGGKELLLPAPGLLVALAGAVTALLLIRRSRLRP